MSKVAVELGTGEKIPVIDNVGWNPVMVQLNLCSIHRSQLVNGSKRGGGKTYAVGMKTSVLELKVINRCSKRDCLR